MQYTIQYECQGAWNDRRWLAHCVQHISISANGTKLKPVSERMMQLLMTKTELPYQELKKVTEHILVDGTDEFKLSV